MVLYVTRPPNPPPGVDWQIEVPGQYIYDVTGITATLTPGGGGEPIMADSSGFALDGQFEHNPFANIVFAQPGIVPGDFAISTFFVPTGFVDGVAPADSFTMGPTDFYAIGWADLDENSDDVYMYVWRDQPFGQIVSWYITPTAGSYDFVLGWSTDLANSFRSFGNVITPGPHMYAVSYDASAKTAYFWVDDTLIDTVTLAVAQIPTTINELGLFVAHNGPNKFDEFVWGHELLDNTNITALYNAGITGISPWAFEVFNYTPRGFYHLDDVSPGPEGRQVLLSITNGSTVVETVPTGFAESTDPGPYLYSWQPKLAARAQIMNGITTTVPTPALVLPAGYTIGSRTLDLGSNDRWSDIAIWWDSSLMDSINNPYHYAPGYRLRYVHDPNAPVD